RTTPIRTCIRTLPGSLTAARKSRKGGLLSLYGSPAAGGAGVVAEAAFHLAAAHGAGELAAHALLVHVGEGDVEAAQARGAKAGAKLAQGDRAGDLLEALLEVEDALQAVRLEVPAALNVGGHDPEVGVPAVARGHLVGLPVVHEIGR